MAVVVLLLLLVLGTTGGSDATWCVCRSDVSDSALQKTLDFACGSGADCTPILQNGGCYQPNTVRAHCSYAANSYYQRKGQAGATCDFSGSATVSSTDPSYGTCTFPSSASTAGTSGTTGTTTIPNGFTSPTNGVLGLGPSTSISTDASDGGKKLLKAGRGCSLLVVVACLALALLNG